MSANDFTDRHSSTQEKMRWLVPNPNLPEGVPAEVSRYCQHLGVQLVKALKDGPQLTLALQQLIIVKDCAVRQAIADGET